MRGLITIIGPRSHWCTKVWEPGEAKSQRRLKVVLLDPNVQSVKSLPPEENNARKALLYQPTLQRKKENLRQHQRCLLEVKVRSCCVNVLCWPQKGKKHFLLSLHSQLANMLHFIACYTAVLCIAVF